MQWHVERLRDSYEQIARDVAEHGDRTSPRGQTTYEIQGALIILENPAESLPVGINRGLNLGIAAVEALQLIGGVSYPELMCRVSDNMSQFRDDGTFHGAYGPRLRSQIPSIVERLKRDFRTRQAIATIWDPLHDLMVHDSKDYPCTLSLHFMVRHSQVHMHTHMRSNDVWWGLPYDIFQFTQLQYTIANQMGVPPGHYFHHVNSLHVYERNLPDIDKLTPPTDVEHPPARGLLNFNSAQRILTGEKIAEGPSGQWFATVMKKYL
jgi:thymidylate synthase